jgi:hypothetical protein
MITIDRANYRRGPAQYVWYTCPACKHPWLVDGQTQCPNCYESLVWTGAKRISLWRPVNA